MEAFGACTDLTGLGTGYSSSKFECIDNEVIRTYYESETCSSGDADLSGATSNSTCDENKKISRCTTEGEGNIRQILCRYLLRKTIHTWYYVLYLKSIVN